MEGAVMDIDKAIEWAEREIERIKGDDFYHAEMTAHLEALIAAAKSR